MIQLLSEKYKSPITWSLFLLCYAQLLSPLCASGHILGPVSKLDDNTHTTTANNKVSLVGQVNKSAYPVLVNDVAAKNIITLNTLLQKSSINSPYQVNIGGPGSPEAGSFKAAGADNLVNLFTGKFSYSIPLMDVGGYPVNLFYNGGITMDQEASWVGLGWNINPGTVNRNMRGVPDDFNGTDTLVQTQNVKPNRTWGAEIGVDGEILGLKAPLSLGTSVGFSYNNYLGPALDFGLSTSVALATIQNIQYESSAKADLGLTLGIGAKLNSRSGLSLSPSLNASLKDKDRQVGVGVGLSTSYNSRTGIKDLTISSQIASYAKQNTTMADESRGHAGTSLRLGSSTISFARPSYIPVLRMPMENTNTSGQLELGVGILGERISGTANGYYSESRVAPESRLVKKPLVGFMYSENAAANKDAVMDFNRLNDGPVTPNTPVISATQYAYDIFSIQGEGTGGSIRAYRGDIGFMRDNVTTSKDKNISLGLDIAPPGHYGANWNVIAAPTRAGGWEDANNTLLRTLNFKTSQPGNSFENIYFKNPGEATVTNDNGIDRIGRDNLVRFKLSGSNASPRLESNLEMFYKKTGDTLGNKLLSSNNNLQVREKRTQVTTMLTAKEASEVGLEKNIRNYSGAFDANNNILYDTISRVSSFRKPHHISEINVLEQNGMRYVYGIPVYSVKQKDFTFSVDNLPVSAADNLVAYDTANDPSVNSRFMNNNSVIDGYVQCQETPAYAASFLITGLLSPDYVDVTGDGITEDDLGGSVKFDYNKSTDLHKWRTPRNNNPGATDLAHFNEGLRTEKRDNKATISYGEREAWYLNAIESKSMVAIFKTDTRSDAKGVKNQFDGTANGSENANKKLTRIDLYTKSEIKAKGITTARPLKSVFFEYGYALCRGTPDNTAGGKLTLKSVYFTYNGQIRNSKDRYIFNYGDTSLEGSADNPAYRYNASDRWGTYKDPSSIFNPSGLTNINYPFTDTSKLRNDSYASAWSLKKILLPSGGQMEMQYESDDYAYVQNRRACNMVNVYGLGNSTAFSTKTAMYNNTKTPDNLYVYIKLPRPLDNTDAVKRKREIFTKYLAGINQLAFKLLVDMPGGTEPLTVYANYDDYGFCTNTGNTDVIYVLLRPLDGRSPLASGAIGFLTNNLPAQAFPGYAAEVNSLPDFINLSLNMLATLKEAFKNVDDQMRSAPKARTIVLGSSFVRLNNPARIKYGGGMRVKRVVLNDNWNKMTGQYSSSYGQDYAYTTTEKADGTDVTISSGVASYEPGIGSEENPFREIETFKNQLPLAAAQYGAIETPVLEGLFPASGIGYSKITVRSIHRKGTHGDSAVRSAIGKQVTEFYTARDYPTFTAYTPMASFDYNKNPFFSLFYKEVINRRTISQGFLVETNDMHGKMKSQSAYSESDEKTPLSASYHSYKNTGVNGLNDQVNFVYNEQGGLVKKGNIGIDMELMTDVREFKVQSTSNNGQIQVDLLTFIFPFVTYFPLKTYQENLYRAVSCTKLINYHAIEDSVIVMDKGSVVSTKTIAYDAETGNPIVTQTANEFNDAIYNINYPAYWAYSSTGLAYKNIGLSFKNVNFLNGKIIAGADTTMFESGDELYVTNNGSIPSEACSAALVSGNVFKLWAFDKNVNNTALTMPVKNLLFMDAAGKLFTKFGIDFRVLRSGKRNNLGLSAGSITCMKNPLQNSQLIADNTSNIVAAAAIEYKGKWQVDKDVVFRKVYFTTCTGKEIDSIGCNGILEKSINPYNKGLVGNLKPYRSYTYYGTRNDSDIAINTTIRKNGYINAFSNFWNFNGLNNLVPDYTNTKWVWNSELSKINAKGQEIETRDALNRYTAAQYGFNKNMPVAVVQNSRNGESFSEGFEDYLYTESISSEKLNNYDNKFINFSGILNSAVTNSDALNFSAHSGKYALKVNANTSSIKPLVVNKTVADNFSFSYKKDTTKQLNDLGGISNRESAIPTTAVAPVFSTTNLGMSLNLKAANVTGEIINNSSVRYYQLYKTVQYIQITVPNTYIFNMTASQSDVPMRYDANYIFNMSAISLEIKNKNDVSIASFTVYSTDSPEDKSVYLPCGIYKLECYGSFDIQRPYDGSNGFHAFGGNCGYSSNCKVSSFKSLSTQNGCISNLPIPATDSMLNPTFALVPGKQMLFSAWVHEDDKDSIVNYKSSYLNNHVELQFPGSGVAAVIVKPSGTIIEGWQKIEGVFNVPANATNANLVLSNDGNKQVYFDDIRIHPFNANMKTYVYDPRSLKLAAELDENNYASFYEYDEEGQLVRVKKETIQGIKTIKETRNTKQRMVTDLQ